MNELFDLNRFVRLGSAHWAENWREYAWFFTILAMLDLIVALICFSGDYNRAFVGFQIREQMSWYTAGLFVSGIVFAGRHFRHVSHPGSALVWLMRPASVLEKWLLALLVVALLYPLAYTLLYLMMNYPMVQLARFWHFALPSCVNCGNQGEVDFRVFIPFVSHITNRFGRGHQILFLKQQAFYLMMLWTMQGLILSGTLFFTRAPILRTVLALFVLSLALFWLGPALHAGPFWSATGNEAIPAQSIEILISLALWTGLPALIWLSALCHLRDREVA